MAASSAILFVSLLAMIVSSGAIRTTFVERLFKFSDYQREQLAHLSGMSIQVAPHNFTTKVAEAACVAFSRTIAAKISYLHVHVTDKDQASCYKPII